MKPTSVQFRVARTLSAIFALALFATAAAAESYIEPSRINVSTPIYKPSFQEFDPPLGTYVYETSWQGIPAAEVSVSVAKDGPHYHIVTSAKTYSGIDLLYKLRYTAEGLIDRDDLTPIKTIINHRENSKEKKYEISFLENGAISSVRTQKGEVKETTFDPGNFTLDPFAAAFLARSLDWNVGDSRYFDTFNGKSRYLITLTAQEKVKMKVNGEQKEVFIIVPKVKKLTEHEKIQKLREAKIYVTADSSRDILQIVSSVFIGSVTTKLETFTPQLPLNGAQIARHKPNRVFFE